MNPIALLAILLLASCVHIPQNVDLGSGYWFISDSYGSNIVYNEDASQPDDGGVSLVPARVIDYDWDDTLIAAVSLNSRTGQRHYWVVDKTKDNLFNKIVLDTLDDGNVVNRMGPIRGPMDHGEFYSFLQAHKLELRDAE